MVTTRSTRGLSSCIGKGNKAVPLSDAGGIFGVVIHGSEVRCVLFCVKARSVIGTPEFMAPELYYEHYTTKVRLRRCVASLHYCCCTCAAHWFSYRRIANVKSDDEHTSAYHAMRHTSRATL